MVLLILEYIRSTFHPRNNCIQSVRIPHITFTPAFMAVGIATLIGYTTYLLLYQIDEESHDEWREGYLPKYPKIRWHLDGAKLS